MVAEITSNPKRSDPIVHKDGSPTKQTIEWFDDLELRINAIVIALGGGGFNGPDGAVQDDLVSFADSTGTLGKDSGILAGDVVQGPTNATAGNIVLFDNASGKLIKNSSLSPTDIDGDFSGPNISVEDNLVSFDDVTGKEGKDSGISSSEIVINPNTATDGNVAQLDATGKVVSDSGKVAANVVEGPGVAVTDGNIASFSSTGGDEIEDSGIVASSVATGPGAATTANHVVAFFDALGRKLIDTGILFTDIVLGPASVTNDTNVAIYNGTSGKAIKDSGLLLADVGDVQGPGSSTENRIALFGDDGDGTDIKQSSLLESEIGIVVKIAEVTEDTVDASINTSIPFDNTPPLAGEGVQVMQIIYSPKFSGSNLIIDVEAMCAGRSDGLTFAGYIVALFDSNSPSAEALNTAYQLSTVDTSATENAYVLGATTKFSATYTTASLSDITFRVRVGKIDALTGNVTFNGVSGSPLFGTQPTSRIRITEYRQ